MTTASGRATLPFELETFSRPGRVRLTGRHVEAAPVTLVDVAEAAGVSVATASRALNSHPNVSSQARERVLSAAKLLRFQPSEAARTLRTRRAHVIGLIVPDISSVFYATALRAAEHTLRRQGYTLFIADTEEDPILELEAVEALVAHRAAGLILASATKSTAGLRRVLKRHPVPVVTIDNRVEGLEADSVLHDNVGGSYALTAHLIQHGHRRIAHLSGFLHETGGAERLQGYRLAMAGAGCPVDSELAPEGDWTQDSGCRLMSALLRSPDAPTAVVASCHAMMVGALKAIRAAGKRIPDDVAMVSFDDTPTGPILDPPITALESQDYEFGRLAAEMLLAGLRGVETRPVREFRLPMRLVPRRSCGCP